MMVHTTNTSKALRIVSALQQVSEKPKMIDRLRYSDTAVIEDMTNSYTLRYKDSNFNY